REHDERQPETYRSSIHTRAAMFLGNGTGWRSFAPWAPRQLSDASKQIREAFAKAKQAGLPGWKVVLVGLAGTFVAILRAFMPRLAYLPALGLGLTAAALPPAGGAIEG